MKLRYKIGGALLVLIAITFGWGAWYVSHDADCVPIPTLSAQEEGMEAIRYGCFGGPEVLELVRVEKPVPGDDEILVRIEAASVNPLDWHYMRGTPYIMRLMGAGIGAPADTRLGADYAGTVIAAGTGVTRFQVGDRVFGRGGGTFAQYLVTAEDAAVAAIPGNANADLFAAVPIAGLTALQALVDKGGLQAGQKVLINGASGGVGTFAVQIAKAMGAEVHGVCSTRNVERVTSLGADRVFDYKKEDYTESGETYDLIIDNVGNHSLMANRKVMADDATLVMVGGEKGDWLGPLMRPISAVFLNPFVDQNFAMLMARLKQEDLATLAGMIAQGQVQPVIDRHFSLAEVPDAIRYSESGRARGKIIIDVE